MTVAFEGVSRINLDRLVLLRRRSDRNNADARTDDNRPTTVATPPPIVFPSSTPTATPTANPRLQNTTLPALPGAASAPRDADGNGRYEDVNGNGRSDFSDVTLLFNNLNTVVSAYPVQAFDFNGNTRVDYGDVTVLYGQLSRAPFTFIYYESLPLS